MLHYDLLKAWMISRMELIDFGDERGEVTEKVIITALFAGLAIAAAAVIVTKVMAKAEGINM